jgi:hypothetical protein
LGERLSPNEASACIGCHTTNAVAGKRLRVQTMTMGVGCEACHGPGGEHVKAIKAGHPETAHIFNPGKLAGGELDDFCGSCHRTWWQVLILRTHSVNNVRFQPYRLENSRCWDAEDTRISCIACHDPHQHRRREVLYAEVSRLPRVSLDGSPRERNCGRSRHSRRGESEHLPGRQPRLR